jgi:hypothetical protein
MRDSQNKQDRLPLGAKFVAGVFQVLGGLVAYLIVGPYQPARAGHVAGAAWGDALEPLLWFGKLVLGVIAGGLVGCLLYWIGGMVLRARQARRARESANAAPDSTPTDSGAW